MPKKRTVARPLTEVERVVLEAYLGEAAHEDALGEAIELLELSGSSFGGDGLPSELDAAAAEIVLQSIRDELPQWALAHVDENKVLLGRNKTSPTRSPFAPVHLFTINWATSGPGISWPVAYYATAVAELRRVAVTASADGEELYGFTDFAIGHFAMTEPLIDGVRSVIIAQWSREAASGVSRWVDLVEDGFVNGETALAWADAVRWAPAPDTQQLDDAD